VSAAAGRSVEDFLAKVEPSERRAECEALIALMERVTGEPAALWGSMVGFGRYHYTYASGHEGDAFLCGFAPRKAEFSIYLSAVPLDDLAGPQAELLGRLGKHRVGKSCLYLRTLKDVDLAVLEELVRLAVATVRRTYPN
jgi:hypothetical protein